MDYILIYEIDYEINYEKFPKLHPSKNEIITDSSEVQLLKRVNELREKWGELFSVKFCSMYMMEIEFVLTKEDKYKIQTKKK